MVKIILKLTNGETFQIDHTGDVSTESMARLITSNSCFIGSDYVISGRHIIRIEVKK